MIQQKAKTVNTNLCNSLQFEIQFYFHAMIFGIANNPTIEVSAKLYAESQLLIIYFDIA